MLPTEENINSYWRETNHVAMSRPLTEDEITIAVADWIGWLAVGVAAISQIPQIIRVINIKTGEGNIS